MLVQRAVELTPTETDEIVHKKHFNPTYDSQGNNMRLKNNGVNIVGRKIDDFVSLDAKNEIRFKPKIVHVGQYSNQYKENIDHVNDNRTIPRKENEVRAFTSSQKQSLTKEFERNEKLNKRKALQKSYTFNKGNHNTAKRSYKTYHKKKKSTTKHSEDSSLLFNSSDLYSSSQSSRNSNSNKDSDSEKYFDNEDEEYNKILDKELEKMNGFHDYNEDNSIDIEVPPVNLKFQFEKADKLVKKLFKNKGLKKYESSSDSNVDEYYSDSSSDSSIFLGDREELDFVSNKVRLQRKQYRKGSNSIFPEVIIERNQLILDPNRQKSKKKDSVRMKEKSMSVRSFSKPIKVKSIDTKFYPNYYSSKKSYRDSSIFSEKPRSKSVSKPREIKSSIPKPLPRKKNTTRNTTLRKEYVTPDYMRDIYRSPKHKIDIIAGSNLIHFR